MSETETGIETGIEIETATAIGIVRALGSHLDTGSVLPLLLRRRLRRPHSISAFYGVHHDQVQLPRLQV